MSLRSEIRELGASARFTWMLVTGAVAGRAAQPVRPDEDEIRAAVAGGGFALRDLLKPLYFFSLVAVSAVALHQLINSGLRQISTSEFGTFNRVVAGDVNADILINGSSRALVHYDPRVIQKITGRTACNLGRNALQTDMQLAFLKAYLAHNRKPAMVIQNLDPFTFVTTHQGEIYAPGFFLPYLNEESIYQALLKVDPGVWKWKYLPLYGYVVEDMRFTWVLGLERLAGFQPPEDNFQGFEPRHSPWTGDFDRFREHNPDGIELAIEPQAVRDLEGLIEVCRQQGVVLVLVYSPEYVGMQALERNRDEVFAKFRQVAERFQVPVWDYSDSPLCRDRANFYNSQHLNAEGAEAFSADLARRLMQSGLLPATERTADSH